MEKLGIPLQWRMRGWKTVQLVLLFCLHEVDGTYFIIFPLSEKCMAKFEFYIDKSRRRFQMKNLKIMNKHNMNCMYICECIVNGFGKYKIERKICFFPVWIVGWYVIVNTENSPPVELHFVSSITARTNASKTIVIYFHVVAALFCVAVMVPGKAFFGKREIVMPVQPFLKNINRIAGQLKAFG